MKHKNTIMKTFEIHYVSRNREQKEHCSAIIKAQSEENALKKFAKISKVKDYKQFFDKNFYWEDGESEWLAWFRRIEEINEINCLHCNGTGKVKIDT
jgi:hypothetical protein